MPGLEAFMLIREGLHQAWATASYPQLCLLHNPGQAGSVHQSRCPVARCVNKRPHFIAGMHSHCVSSCFEIRPVHHARQ
jgi:hypothetical protein